MDENRPVVTIYTDGAADPNPGPGGWAAILLSGPHRKELVGAEPQTTNNRMELTAAIAALTALRQSSQVEFHTDSEYLRQGITEWLPGWVARGWKTGDKRPVKNQDLWQLLAEVAARHTITWHWVKGHAGNPLNEAVDRLATSQIPRAPLPLNAPNQVHIFPAASGQGRWAVLVRLGEDQQSLSGTEVSSANRLHIRAALEGLRAAKATVPAHVYTTSEYLFTGAGQWLPSWRERNWHKADGQPVLHADLWQALATEMARRSVTWHILKNEVPAETKAAEKLAHRVDQAV